MGVRGEFGVRRSDQQSARHAKMDDPLGGRWSGKRFSQFTNNMLAGAVNGLKQAAFEALCLFSGAGFEGLFVATKPGLDNAVALDANVHAVGDGFYFRQLRHKTIVEASCRVTAACICSRTPAWR